MDSLGHSDRGIHHLALLRVEDIVLSFPQAEVLSIESLAQMDTAQLMPKSSGTLLYRSSELPVFTLNRDLALMVQAASGNRFCVAIKHPDTAQYFALTCDAVNQHSVEDETKSSDIPAVMQSPGSPITRLLKIDNKLVLMSSAEAMRSYINSTVGG
jgi:hypothetical protein